jgi:hypothetical protein
MSNGTPGVNGVIYTYGHPVSDITGYKLNLLLHYRDRLSAASSDHPPSKVPEIGVLWAASKLGTTPLSQLFDNLWSKRKNPTSGQTLEQQAVQQVTQTIQSDLGSSKVVVTGGFPATGRLRSMFIPAYLGPGPSQPDLLVLSFWLSGASFTLGNFVKLTFDTELLVYIRYWPKVVVSADLTVCNSNISGADAGAQALFDLASLGAWLSGQPTNIFQGIEGIIDDTTEPVPNFGKLAEFLNLVSGIAGPLGLVHFSATPDPDPSTSTLIMRLIHEVDPAPKVVSLAASSAPRLQGPVIRANPTQVHAGEQVSVSGSYFSPASANSCDIGWDDTVSGTLTESEIHWVEVGKPAQDAKNRTLSRKPWDNGNHFNITDLRADKHYNVQVRDGDQLTWTDWGKFSIKTQKSDSVDIALKSGSSTKSLGTATRDSSGQFEMKATIPAGTAAGTHTLTASDSADAASTPLEVLGAGKSAKPKIYSVDSTGGVASVPVIVVVGAPLDLHGEGFRQGKVTIAIQGGPSLGTANAAADGSFTAKPTLSNHGNFTVVASQGSGPTGLQATLAVSVLSQPT